MNNDLISREALKKKLQARHDNGEEDFDKGYNIGIETAIDLINNAPSIEYTFEEAFQKTVCENKLYCPARPQGDIHDFISKADEDTLFQLKKEIENALTKIIEREAYEEARREAMKLDEADGTLKGRGYA